MSSWVLATACPRGDCCVHRALHEVVFINSALNLCLDCWYTNVAIWNTRSIPCIQISNDFKFPTILCSKWRCSVGNMRYLELETLTPLFALMVKGAVPNQPRGTSAAIRLRTIVGWRRLVISGGRYVDLDTAPIQYPAFEVPLLWKAL